MTTQNKTQRNRLPLVLAVLLACGGRPVDMEDADAGEPTMAPEPDLPMLPPDMGAETLCGGVPVDLNTSPVHCGECDNQCPVSSSPSADEDLGSEPCIAGECQTWWTECLRLDTLQGNTCEQLCGSKGCAAEGCAGQTLAVWRNLEVSVGTPVDGCPLSTDAVELQEGYGCSDVLPAAVNSGDNAADFFSCCCSP